MTRPDDSDVMNVIAGLGCLLAMVCAAWWAWSSTAGELAAIRLAAAIVAGLVALWLARLVAGMVST